MRLTLIKIVSSHGHFIADPKGNVITRHDASGDLPKVRKFDFHGWQYAAGSRPLREEMDILELNYVTVDGRHEKAAA